MRAHEFDVITFCLDIRVVQKRVVIKRTHPTGLSQPADGAKSRNTGLFVNKRRRNLLVSPNLKKGAATVDLAMIVSGFTQKYVSFFTFSSAPPSSCVLLLLETLARSLKRLSISQCSNLANVGTII